MNVVAQSPQAGHIHMPSAHKREQSSRMHSASRARCMHSASRARYSTLDMRAKLATRYASRALPPTERAELATRYARQGGERSSLGLRLLHFLSPSSLSLQDRSKFQARAHRHPIRLQAAGATSDCSKRCSKARCIGSATASSAGVAGFASPDRSRTSSVNIDSVSSHPYGRPWIVHEVGNSASRELGRSAGSC